MNLALFQFELEEGADAGGIAESMHNDLCSLESVNQVEFQRDESRIGVGEMVEILAAGVILVRGTTELVVSVRTLVEEVERLILKFPDIRAAFLEVCGRRVALQDLTEADLEELSSR